MTQTPSHAHLPRRKTRMLVLCTGHGRGLRGCHGPRISHHAVAALDGITGARVDWADSKDLGRSHVMQQLGICGFDTRHRSGGSDPDQGHDLSLCLALHQKLYRVSAPAASP